MANYFLFMLVADFSIPFRTQDQRAGRLPGDYGAKSTNIAIGMNEPTNSYRSRIKLKLL